MNYEEGKNEEKKKERKKWSWFLLSFFFLFLLVILYALPGLLAPAGIYSSPDEAANVFFIGQVAENWRLAVPWPMAEGVSGLLHPRSMRVVDGMLVPGGFATLVAIYGVVARVLGMGIVVWLTPLLAAVAVWWWGRLVAVLSGSRVTGVVAAMLLGLHPVWWFWASRGLMPNVPFVALVIGAAWFWVKSGEWGVGKWESGNEVEGKKERRKEGIYVGLSGVLLAVALAIRPSEIYWIGLGVGGLVLMNWRVVVWRRWVVFVAGMAVVLLPFLWLHIATFGWGFGGYGASLTEVGVEVPHGLGDRLLGPLQPWLFPLGFAPRTALVNFWNYGVSFFWWWTLGVVVAGGVLVAKWVKNRSGGWGVGKWGREKVGICVMVVLMVGWLIFFYGSLLVGDNSAGEVTIGVSYFRYWLPIFVLSTVPVAVLLGRGWRLGKVMIGMAVGCYVVASSMAVVFAPAEGLVASQLTLQHSAAAREFIVVRTEKDAVVVVDRADKFLFPSRLVLQPLRSDYSYRSICELYPRQPIYYYGITLPATDLNYIREVKLRSCGLAFQAVESLGEETLYRVVRADVVNVAYVR